MEPAPDEGGERPAEQALLDRLELIESQPLAQRAAGFDQLAEELLAELQRSDQDAEPGSAAGPSAGPSGGSFTGTSAGA